MAHANIRDVAALAGVAVSTVSVVLNDVSGARVSDSTRRRIQEAADVLGYTPNAHARGLRASSAGALALVTDRITTSPYGGGIIHGAIDAAWRAGVTVMVLTYDDQPDREEAALRFANAQRCTGIILATAQYDDRDVPRGRNLVLANCQPRDESQTPAPPHAVPDERRAGTDAVRELVELGHRDIAIAAVDSPGDRRRMQGIRQEFERCGLPWVDERVHVSAGHNATAPGGREAATHLLRIRPRPTALICHSDRMAMGAYQAVADAGLRVPDDVSVLGFDDLEPVAESLSPGLTTWALPGYEMGEWAVEVCLDRQHPAWADDARHVRFERPIVRRFSAGPPRNRSTAPSVPTRGSQTREDLR